MLLGGKGTDSDDFAKIQFILRKRAQTKKDFAVVDVQQYIKL